MTLSHSSAKVGTRLSAHSQAAPSTCLHATKSLPYHVGRLPVMYIRGTQYGLASVYNTCMFTRAPFRYVLLAHSMNALCLDYRGSSGYSRTWSACRCWGSKKCLYLSQHYQSLHLPGKLSKKRLQRSLSDPTAYGAVPATPVMHRRRQGSCTL